MTIWTGRSKTELLDEWICTIEYLENLRRLRSAMRADEQRLGATTWKTIEALAEVIAEEASKADELRHFIDAGAAAVERAPTRTRPLSASAREARNVPKSAPRLNDRPRSAERIHQYSPSATESEPWGGTKPQFKAVTGSRAAEAMATVAV